MVPPLATGSEVDAEGVALVDVEIGELVDEEDTSEETEDVILGPLVDVIIEIAELSVGVSVQSHSSIDTVVGAVTV